MKKAFLLFVTLFFYPVVYAECVNIHPQLLYILPDIDQIVSIVLENVCDYPLESIILDIPDLSYTRVFSGLISYDKFIFVVRLAESSYNYTVNIKYNTIQEVKSLIIFATKDETVSAFISNKINSEFSDLNATKEKLNVLFIGDKSKLSGKLADAESLLNKAVEYASLKRYSDSQLYISEGQIEIEQVKTDVAKFIRSQNFGIIIISLFLMFLFMTLLSIKEFYNFDLRPEHILSLFRIKYHPPNRTIEHYLSNLRSRIIKYKIAMQLGALGYRIKYGLLEKIKKFKYKIMKSRLKK